jgi:hypothetical protein
MVGPFVLTVRLRLTQRYGPNAKSLTIDGMLWLHGEGRDGVRPSGRSPGVYSEIMGALLNALSGAMAALPFVRLTETPRARMDDFAKWVTAAKK